MDFNINDNLANTVFVLESAMFEAELIYAGVINKIMFLVLKINNTTIYLTYALVHQRTSGEYSIRNAECSVDAESIDTGAV